MPLLYDIHHMKSAISLARRGLGRCAPNPSVGCVIVKNDIIISRSNTADGGRPHAETIALIRAGAQAKGATLYVSLEPCTHHGKTPPCVDAVIKAGISRVVIGAKDVDPRVSGKSIQKLKGAGIEVVTGILEEECNALNIGFISRITKKRPFVTLKTACSMDGKVALSSGESQWITGELARAHAHQVRASHDAILVGIGTVIADNPSLTTRINGFEHNVIRVILDSDLRIPTDSNLVKTANENSLWVLYNPKHKEKESRSKLIDMGVELHETECSNLVSVLELLAEQGITRLLVEGGQGVHTSFIKAGLCDDLLIYRAPKILGDDAKGIFADLNIDILAKSYKFKHYHTQKLGQDMLERYKCSQD